MTKNCMFFATVLGLVPENVYCKKITANGLTADCQLVFCKIYEYISHIFMYAHDCGLGTDAHCLPIPEVIEDFSCSFQLSIKF